jgi:hypothetical protein
MDLQIVTEAVRRLRADHQRITVRAVHSLTGGSFRDLTKLLRDAREFLEEDEADELDAEAEPTPPPSLGRITEARLASQDADRQAGEVAAVLNDTQEQLRELVAHRPPPALVPEEVAASVDARLDHDLAVAHLHEEINQLRRIVEGHQAEARAHRIEGNNLERRAAELTNTIISDRRQRLIDARNSLTRLERDVEHQLMLARRQVAN